MALAELGRLDEALTLHRQAIARAPKDAEPHYMLGLNSVRGAAAGSGRSGVPRRSRARFPAPSPRRGTRSAACWSMGRLDEALDCFRRALRSTPICPRPIAASPQPASGPATTSSCAPANGAASPERSVLDRVAAGFALRGLLDNADRYDDAFPALPGNALYRQFRAEAGERFDADALRRETDGLIGVGSAEFFSRVGAGQPVGTAGLYRRHAAFGHHPDRADRCQPFASVRRRRTARDRRLATALTAHNTDRADRRMGPGLRPRASRPARGLVAGAGRRERARDRQDAGQRLYPVADCGAVPVGAGHPFQRDPRDTALSCYFPDSPTGIRSPTTSRIAATGRLRSSGWRRIGCAVLPLDMLVVDYEELVADPEGESRRLIEFLGLDWEPACLDFHRTERTVFSASLPGRCGSRSLAARSGAGGITPGICNRFSKSRLWTAMPPSAKHHKAEPPAMPKGDAWRQADGRPPLAGRIGKPADANRRKPPTGRQPVTSIENRTRPDHQAGRLDRAEALYRTVLADDPDHADALHLLGVLAYQCGKPAAALQLIERALPSLAELPDAHLNYGNALRDLGGRPRQPPAIAGQLR